MLSCATSRIIINSTNILKFLSKVTFATLALLMISDFLAINKALIIVSVL